MKHYALAVVLIFYSCSCSHKEPVETILKRYALDYLKLDSLSNLSELKINHDKVLYLLYRKNAEDDAYKEDEFSVVDLKTRKKITSIRNRFVSYYLVDMSLDSNGFCFAENISFPSYYMYDFGSKKIQFINNEYIKQKWQVQGMAIEKKNNQLFVFGSPYGIFAIDLLTSSVFPEQKQGFVNGSYSTISYPISDSLNFICGTTNDYTKDPIYGYCIDQHNRVLWSHAFLNYQLESNFHVLASPDSYVFLNSSELFSLKKIDGRLQWKTTVDLDAKFVYLYDSTIVLVGKSFKDGKNIILNTYDLASGKKIAERTFLLRNDSMPFSIGILSSFLFLSLDKGLYCFSNRGLNEVFYEKCDPQPFLEMYFDRSNNKPYLYVDGLLLW